MLPAKPRHELKFLLPIAEKEKFLEAIQFAIRPDSNTGPDGFYRVSSLYYDTSDKQAFYEKLDGVLRRKKFRLRRYGRMDGSPSPAFFEIKHRFASMICKERTCLTAEISDSLYQGQLMPEQLASSSLGFPVSLAHQIEFNHPSLPLEPAVLVSYLRQAWVGLEEPDLRITFDTSLSAHPPEDYTSPGRVAGQGFLEDDQAVLEVKFDHQLPRWLQQRLISRGLHPVRYSKYAEAELSRGIVEMKVP